MSDPTSVRVRELKPEDAGKSPRVVEGTPSESLAPEVSAGTSQRTSANNCCKGGSGSRKRANEDGNPAVEHKGIASCGPVNSGAVSPLVKRVKHEFPLSKVLVEEEEVSVDEEKASEDAGDDDSSLREAGGGLIALQTGSRGDGRSRIEEKIQEAVIGLKEHQGDVVREAEGEVAVAARQADEDQDAAQKSRNRVNQADVAVKRAEDAAKMARKARRKLDEAAREAEERASMSVAASKEATERLGEVVDLQRREKEAMLGRLVVQTNLMMGALKELQVVAGHLAESNPEEFVNPDDGLAEMEQQVKKINSIWLRYSMERRKLTEVIASLKHRE